MNHDHSNRGGPRNNALLPGGGGQGQGRVEGHRRSRMHRGGGHGDDDFVDTELRAQGEAIEEEARYINTNMLGGGNPNGHSDFDREKQAEAARARLEELEERLGRLHLLDRQIKQLRSAEKSKRRAFTADVPSTDSEDDWAGVENKISTEEKAAGHVPRTAPKSRYARPVTPGLIRKIIREEVVSAVKGSSPTGDPRYADLAGGHPNLIAPENGGRLASLHATMHQGPLAGEVDLNAAVPVAELVNENPAQEGHDQNGFLSKERRDKAFKKTFGDYTSNQVVSTAPKLQNAKQFAKTGLVRIQSRKTMADKKKAVVMGEPKNLDEAVDVSCPLLFGGFSRRSAIRIKCFEIYDSSLAATFFLLVTLANSIYIAIAGELEQGGEGGSGFTPLEIFDLCCVVILFLEMFNGIIALGFCWSPNTWLRCSDFHKLDSLVLLVTAGEYVAAILGSNSVTLRPFRLLRVFRAIVKIKSFLGVKTIIRTLRQGITQLGVVILMLFFFMCGFGIFGMAMYQRSFSRRCVMLPQLVPACANSDFGAMSPNCSMAAFQSDTGGPFELDPGGHVAISGGFPFESFCKIMGSIDTPGAQKLYGTEFPVDPDGNYHSCQAQEFRRHRDNSRVTQKCEIIGNPDYNFAHFDHIGGAFVNIFMMSAGSGGPITLHRMVQSEPLSSVITYLYAFFIVCLNTFLMLGLFVAVVTGTFKRVREKQGSALMKKEDSEAVGMFDLLKNVGGKKKSKRDDEEEDGDAALFEAANAFMNNPRIKHLMSLTILLHASAMAADQYNASDLWQLYSIYMSMACNLVFTVETMVRFVAAGSVQNFWQSGFARFELALVICGVSGIVTGTKLLLLIPSARIFRLCFYFPTLMSLLLSAVASINATLNLVLFIGIVALCFSVTGRYLFRTFMDDITRSNFGTFGQAMLTIFQLLTGDNWSGVLFASMESKTTWYGQTFACSFILAWFAFSKLIVSNLFIAVIIENFQVTDTIAHIRRPGRIAYVISTIQGFYQDLLDRSSEVLAASKGADKRSATVNNAQQLQDKIEALGYVNKNAISGHGAALISNLDKVHSGKPSKFMEPLVQECTLPPGKKVEEMEEDESERVLFMFEPESIIRRFFIFIGNQFLFDTIVFAAIIASCVFLMITPPYPDMIDYSHDVGKNTVEPPITLETMDMWNSVITIIFTIELMVRCMSQGLLFTKKAYLRSGWNLLDFIVLAFAWIDEMNISENGKIAKVFRLARALRPLRLMKRNQGMRVVIDALITTIQPVMYVIFFSAWTFCVFALVGQGLFGGKLYRCSEGEALYPQGKLECSGVYVVGKGSSFSSFLAPRTWENPHNHFDTYYEAILTLFRINTVKYVGIMFDVMDVTEIDMSPTPNYSSENSLFFITYLIVGALFVMNLFVGYIVDGFEANKGSEPADRMYTRFNRLIKSCKPKYDYFAVPKGSLAAYMRAFISSTSFQVFSGACVFVNVVFMLADHVTTSESWLALMDLQNLIFYLELWFEILLFIAGYGFGCFYNDPWKGFDLLVALGTSAGYVADNAKLAQFAKSFRLMRVVRLMKMIKAIRIILETLLQSIPQLMNIILLLFLIYSMFAVVAVQSYGNIKTGVRIGVSLNFDSYINALHTICMTVTGAEWYDILADCSVEYPYCTPKFTNDPADPLRYHHSGPGGYDGPNYSFGDCGADSARFFFVILKLICENIMLNLFIGMIIDNFSFITDEVAQVETHDWSNGASQDQVQELADAFQKYDAKSGFMSITALNAFMCTVHQPLGFRDDNDMIIFDERDRVSQILVRAELNVLHREWLDMMEKKAARPFYRRMIRAPKIEKKKRFIMWVSFEQVMYTLLYWRKPEMVPNSVKYQRAEGRITSVIMMAQKLIIADFFRSLVAERIHYKITGKLQQRTDMKQWSSTDVARQRRTLYVATKTAKTKEYADKRGIPHDKIYVAPSKFSTVQMTLSRDLPDNVVTQYEAIREMHIKVPKPHVGIDAFTTNAVKKLVVLKFVDPFHALEYPDFIVADMRGADWGGWSKDNQTLDSVWAPHNSIMPPAGIRRGASMHNNDSLSAGDAASKAHANVWSQVEIDLEGNSLGVVEDLQSFVIWEGKEEHAEPVNVVRLNIAAPRKDSHDPRLMTMQAHKHAQLVKSTSKRTLVQTLSRRKIAPVVPQMEDGENEESMSAPDAVLEVVGYMSNYSQAQMMSVLQGDDMLGGEEDGDSWDEANRDGPLTRSGETFDRKDEEGGQYTSEEDGGRYTSDDGGGGGGGGGGTVFASEMGGGGNTTTKDDEGHEGDDSLDEGQGMRNPQRA